jgi:hypothetical protein
MTAGRTCPILCGCSDRYGEPAGEFVIKLLGQPTVGESRAVFEIVASRLARHFGILVPEPAVVEVTPKFGHLLGNSQPRLLPTLSSNIGLNFGTRVVNPMTTWITGRPIPESLLADAVNIFAFDALIKNPDRRVEKPNLFTRGDELYVFDHEMAFSFLFAIGSYLPPWDLRNETYLRGHVFFSRLKSKNLDLGHFKARLEALDDAEIVKINSEIPKEWIGPVIGRIWEHISMVRMNSERFIEQVERSLA